MQGSWGHLGAFGANFSLSQAAAGIPCQTSTSAFTYVSSQHASSAKDITEGASQNAQFEVMKPQAKIAQPQQGFLLTGPGMLPAHLPTHAIPLMDGSRQAAMMAQNAAFFNPVLYQQAMGMEMMGWNQFAGFPQIKQEPGVFAHMTGGMGGMGGMGMGLAQPPGIDFKNMVTPEMLQMQAHLQNAQAASALSTNNFVQVFDETKAPVGEQQNSSENHSPEPNKFTPRGRIPRWKRRNNVKHVAGERARRARTSNKVKVIRGLLPQLSANASFNDMVQMIIDVAREAANEARKDQPEYVEKEPAKKDGVATDGSGVLLMPVVQCSDHRSMIRGSGSVASLVLDVEDRIVEASAALVKNVQGDLHESKERLVGEKLSTVVQPDHAASIAEEIASLRQALLLDSEARASPRKRPEERGGEDTEEDEEKKEQEKGATPLDAAHHFVRRGVMCKAGPARGDSGTLKPLARMDAYVTVSLSASLVMFLSADGFVDAEPNAELKGSASASAGSARRGKEVRAATSRHQEQEARKPRGFKLEVR
eukprot:CAMPEP_0177734858 /NCGR_PEP_ID=MMETSP0484_2-20121128/24463_1 /TAXON_ID=354590 /ORGANISM="Rhodomonas lens, Strain RHODO" /LENGTH=535 /DNA_ID=CAMNT_0019248375 /DNA_START=89 /DNA_END=1694 /DNA_ORIENTATION=+